MSSSECEMKHEITVISLPGLHLDSLGLGLSALGLLSLCSRRWPIVRGGWRGSIFYLAGGPPTKTELIEYIATIGERGEWSSYRKGWDKQQKADTKTKGGKNIALWCALEADEETLALHQSHIAHSARLSFNPLFGTGGNAGKRDFSIGWAKAAAAIETPPRGWKREALNADLEAFLNGEPGICLADYNAGCWFGAANKSFNSGTAKPFREGQISPWAMTLACESFRLFQGSTSRRLGISRRAIGSFPFVTSGAAPTAAGEAGKNLGELWLPIWEQPMSMPEINGLFQRGRAEVNGHGAMTSPAFAAALMQRGVDSGIREFRRFLLLRTTSENTFESRLASVISVAGISEGATATALTRMLGCRDSLPADRKKGKRWVYAGLRGPMDEALVAFAENPVPELARASVDAMICALRKADRNRGHRAHMPSIQFQQLPGAWATSLLSDDGGDASAEARIGLGLATLFESKRNGKAKKGGTAQLLPYWLGVQKRGIYCSIPEAIPLRRVWGAGGLATNLAAILQQRLIEEEPPAEPPFNTWHRVGVGLGDIEAWLLGALDDPEVERWMMRFSLFDWKEESIEAVLNRLGQAFAPEVVSGSLTLFALFKPLFQPGLLKSLQPAGSKRLAAKNGPLHAIAAQLSRGDLTVAVQLARNAYRATCVEPAKLLSEQFTCADPKRLVAAMLIPAQSRGITHDYFDGLSRIVPALCNRWLSPRKTINNT